MVTETSQLLTIGQVIKPHGIRGEVAVEIWIETPETFSQLEHVYLERDQTQAVAVEAVRFHKGRALLKLAGYEDRTAAEGLRGEIVLASPEAVLPSEAGSYALEDLLGMAVWTTEDAYLGEIVDYIETGANDVIVVAGEEGEVLLPVIEEVVLHVDWEGQRMTVALLEGLL